MIKPASPSVGWPISVVVFFHSHGLAVGGGESRQWTWRPFLGRNGSQRDRRKKKVWNFGSLPQLGRVTSTRRALHDQIGNGFFRRMPRGLPSLAVIRVGGGTRARQGYVRCQSSLGRLEAHVPLPYCGKPVSSFFSLVSRVSASFFSGNLSRLTSALSVLFPGIALRRSAGRGLSFRRGQPGPRACRATLGLVCGGGAFPPPLLFLLSHPFIALSTCLSHP
ncbi:hypothetical protein MAPG_02161 [Magnaporthiopsis poae ATCC 64411]|uniref:Uncharacterized protein n=1 Tax=Magnaporthiopsis poae (strain ATCC 64411 / 73-15) TaxID=644358 RepID=A0A0C4DQL7_MAGP6|nr:hypothetical protein MAPG_02161 [Magnaporthiopsis poae ATCC 64411]